MTATDEHTRESALASASSRERLHVWRMVEQLGSLDERLRAHDEEERPAPRRRRR